MAKIGVWLIGALGNVATCTVLGVEAIKCGLASRTGLVTELPEFQALGLASLDDFVFGGCDLRESDLLSEALKFSRTNHVPSVELIQQLKEPLRETSARFTRGTSLNCGPAVERFVSRRLEKDGLGLPDLVAKIQTELAEFKKRYGLDVVVVVNLASAESFVEIPAPFVHEPVCVLVEKDLRHTIPASVLYAYSALKAGYPYINFTSSIGSSVPNLDELARLKGIPHMGKDGKTGETLVKTALAPMFVARHLKLLSWESHNILGNSDGKVLNEDGAKEGKLKDKRDVLKAIAPDDAVHSNVHIDYVPSLGDWKTAWDFIHFAGFLDTKMSLQFTWQGADSLLAAPLVIDLVRLAEFALRQRESGAMAHTACFFKAPYGVTEQNFYQQFEMLLRYVQKHAEKQASAVKSALHSPQKILR